MNTIYDNPAVKTVIIDRISQRNVFIEQNGTKIPALVSGKTTKFPIAYTSTGLMFEISWRLAEDLAYGRTDTILACAGLQEGEGGY